MSSWSIIWIKSQLWRHIALKNVFLCYGQKAFKMRRRTTRQKKRTLLIKLIKKIYYMDMKKINTLKNKTIRYLITIQKEIQYVKGTWLGTVQMSHWDQSQRSENGTLGSIPVSCSVHSLDLSQCDEKEGFGISPNVMYRL